MIITLKNANAGKTRKQILSREISRWLGEKGHLVETHSLEELEKISREVYQSSPKLIVIWGGDGTVTATLSALSRAYGETPLPPLCLLPGGTVNVIPRCVGVKGSPEKAFLRLLAAVRGERPLISVRRTLLRIGERAGFLFGVGLMANFLDAYYDGGRPGKRGALATLARSIWDAFRQGDLTRKLFVSFRGSVTVDGQKLPEETLVNISVGSVEGLGLGFNPYLRAAERPGYFHWITHNLSPLATARELPGIRLGWGMKNVTQDIASHMRVELDRKMRFGLDGETFEARDSFEIKGGTSVQLAVP